MVHELKPANATAKASKQMMLSPVCLRTEARAFLLDSSN
jgi:hypothetical protein